MLKVGDRVIVAKKESKAYLEVGTIIDVDEDWIMPYEVEFDNDKVNKYIKNEEELYNDDDLKLLSDYYGDSKGTVNKSTNVESDPLLHIEMAIRGVISEFGGKNPPAAVNQALIKLEESRMWLMKARDYIERRNK